MEVCNVFLNNLNTFCKEFYTCTCKMQHYKEIVFSGVKMWYSETLTKH